MESLKSGSTSPRAHMIEVLPTETHPHARFQLSEHTTSSDGKAAAAATHAPGSGSSELMKKTFWPNKNSTTIDQPGLRTQRQPRQDCGDRTAAQRGLRGEHCGESTAASGESTVARRGLRREHCGDRTAARALRREDCDERTAARALGERREHCGKKKHCGERLR